jgi:hypothetical protein
MEQMSTKLCNSMLDTGSLKAAFTNMELRIYSGTIPASADAAITGTKIAVVKNGASYATFGTASGGVIGINSTETWSDTSAVGGVATHYRLVSHADDDGATGSTYPRIQGTVGVGGSDMNVGNTTITAGTAFPVNTFNQALIPT